MNHSSGEIAILAVDLHIYKDGDEKITTFLNNWYSLTTRHVENNLPAIPISKLTDHYHEDNASKLF